MVHSEQVRLEMPRFHIDVTKSKRCEFSMRALNPWSLDASVPHGRGHRTTLDLAQGI